MPLGRSGRLRIYVLAVAGGALLLLLSGNYSPVGGQAQFWNPFGVLLGTGLLAEAVALQLRHGTTRSAVSFVPFLAALVLVGPSWAMVVAIALVAALSYKSNRNWTLPNLDYGFTTNTNGFFSQTQDVFVTYILSSSSGYTSGLPNQNILCVLYNDNASYNELFNINRELRKIL